MSFQQDYLLRMIQDLNAFMSRVIRLRREARPEEALELLTEESTRVAGLPPSLVYALSDDDLISTLTARGALEPERCFTIAELFREEGLVYNELDSADEASVRFAKATRLYTEALRLAPPDHPDIDMAGLRETLSNVHASNLSESTLDLLLETLIEREAYDLADNVIFELLEIEDDTGGPTERAEHTYRAILAGSDYALSRCGLERGEIEEALAALDTESKWV
jgi:tetratricopeptide (TPR) repeat protein